MALSALDIVVIILVVGCAALGVVRGFVTEVLSLMAEGHSNPAIAQHLVVSAKTVETHVRNVFQKLGLDESPTSSRRVLAVLTYLRS